MKRPHACRMQAGADCPMSTMRTDESSMVYPGGATRCLSNTRPEYAFQVVPRSKSKLLLLFDGGGACWNKLTVDADACNKKSVIPMPLEGMMSNEGQNPFRNHTIVYVQYCSGDLHAGSVIHPFRDKDNGVVEQRGFENTGSAIAWAKANLDPELESFVLAGQSAGAIAVQVWAWKALGEFHYQQARVISDSYAGVFPQGFQGPVFSTLGVCKNDLLPPQLADSCGRKDITMSDVFVEAMRAYPRVAFATVDSMYDVEQLSFYKKAALSMGRMPELVQFSKDGFAEKLKAILRRYSAHANHFAYIRPSSDHVYTTCNRLFNMSAFVNGRERPLVEWLALFQQPAVGSLGDVCQDAGPGRFCGQALARRRTQPASGAAGSRQRRALDAPQDRWAAGRG